MPHCRAGRCSLDGRYTETRRPDRTTTVAHRQEVHVKLSARNRLTGTVVSIRCGEAIAA